MGQLDAHSCWWSNNAMSQAKFTTLLITTVAILIIVFQNRAPVSTHFLFFSFVMPQIVLLLIAVGLGFVAGLTVAAQSKSKGGGYKGR
jgi:uncharacterized integral membrane protein